MLLTLVLTGRRRAEVISLRAGDLSLEGEAAFYAYRGKGGKGGRRELPYPAYEAICATLADAGKELAAMAPDESLWKAAAQPEGVTSGTFYSRFHRYLAAAGLAPTGIHVLRHTAAKLRREPEILDELLARARPVVAGREWRGRGNPLRGHDPSLGVRRARKPAKPDQRPDV